jgi:ATP-dependent Lon protease
VLVEGVSRVAIEGFGDQEGALTGQRRRAGVELRARRARDGGDAGLADEPVRAVREDQPQAAAELLTTLAGIDDAGRVADTIAAHLGARLADKQRLLETLDVGQRLEVLIGLVDGEIDVQQIEKRIRGRVKSQMERSQREYYLNEQMKAIQKELGDLDEAPNEIEELAKKIAAAGMPKAVEAKARAEFAKLKQMSPMSAEATGGAQLPGLAAERAVEEAHQDPQGPQGRRPGARRRPLRPGEGQGPHP